MDYDLKRGWQIQNIDDSRGHADFYGPLDPREIAPEETGA